MSATDSITVQGVLPAPVEEVFSAWLDGPRHTAMTGGDAKIDPKVGGAFTAWDDYIRGTTLEIEASHRIVQSWRTTQFPDEAPDSRLEIRFDACEEGTRVTFEHSEIPAGQGVNYEGGWVSHYLTPMAAYFAK